MATGITGDFVGLGRLIFGFEKLATGAFKTGLSVRLADSARSEVGKSFDEERDPYGERWKDLKPATLKARRKGGVGAKILQDTRRLRQSVTSHGAYSSGSDGFQISTNVIYAAIHNFGGEARGISIPKRQFIPSGTLGSIWTKAFQKEAELFMADLFKGIG